MPIAETALPANRATKTNGQNGIQIVMVNQAAYVARALTANYSEFPKSCLWVNFAFTIKIGQVLINGRNADTKQLRHEALRKP